MFLIEFQPHLTCKCVWCFLVQTTADLAISIVFILELKIMHVISQCSNANICFCFINIYKYLINLEAPFSEKSCLDWKKSCQFVVRMTFLLFSLKQQQFKHLEKQFKVLILSSLMKYDKHHNFRRDSETNITILGV